MMGELADKKTQLGCGSSGGALAYDGQRTYLLVGYLQVRYYAECRECRDICCKSNQTFVCENFL